MADGAGTKLDTLYWEIEVRLAQAKAEQDALAAGQAAGEAFEKGADLGNKGAEGASKWVASLISDLKARRQEITREAVAGLITTEEAAAAGRAASAEYVKELRGGLDALKSKGVIQATDLPGLLSQGAAPLKEYRSEIEKLGTTIAKTPSIYDNLSRSVYVQAYAMDAARNSTNKHGEATEHAIPGLGRITVALEGVIHKATETNPALAKISTTLLEMGVGGLVTTAVLGGVALMVLAYQKLTQGARESQEQIDKVVDSLQKQVEAEFNASRAGKQAIADAALFGELQAQARLDAARLGTEQSVAGKPGVTRRVVDLDEVKKAEEELKAAQARRDLADRATQESEASIESRRAEAVGRALAGGRKNNELIAEATSLTKKYNDELARTLASGKTDDATLARINTLGQMIDALTAADKKAAKAGETAAQAAARLKSQQDAARQAFGTATAAQTPDKVDNFDEQVTKLTEQAVKAKLSADEIRKLVTDLRAAHAEAIKQQSQALGDDLRSQLVAMTKTQVDDLILALDKLDEKVAQSRLNGTMTPENEGLAAQLRAARVAAIETAREVEALQDKLDNIDRVRAATGNDIGAVSKLINLKDELNTELRITKNADDQRRILKEIEDIDRRIKGIVDGQAKPVEEIASKTQQLAGQIAVAANIALGLASAFAGANSEITKMLAGVSQTAGGVQNLLAATHTKDAKGNDVNIGLSGALGTAQGLGALGQIIGGGIALGAQIFGETPAEKARAERQKENTEAIRKLTERVGTLSQITVSGADISSARDALAGLSFHDQGGVLGKLEGLLRHLNPFGTSISDAGEFKKREDALKAALKEQGLSVTEFTDILKSLGVTLDVTKLSAKDLKEAQDALNQAALVRFGSSFAGQMQELDAEVKLFPDLTEPIKQFDAFRKAIDKIKDGGGVLSKVLKDFDLSTSEGIAAAQAALQELFKKLEAGTLTAADLGGLTPDEFLQALLKAQDFIDAQKSASAKGGAAGTGGFNFDRTITEVTGSRIGALLSTANVFQERTAEATEGIWRQLSGGIEVPVIGAPPSTASSGSAIGAPLSISLDIDITVSGPLTDAQAQGVGQQIGQATIKAIDSGLGNRAKWANRAAGSVLRS